MSQFGGENSRRGGSMDQRSGRRGHHTTNSESAMGIGNSEGRSGGGKISKISIAVIAQSTAAITSFHYTDASPFHKALLRSTLFTNLLGFLSCVSSISLVDDKPEDAKILEVIGIVVCIFGFIQTIALFLPANLVWTVVLPCLAFLLVIGVICLAKLARKKQSQSTQQATTNLSNEEPDEEEEPGEEEEPFEPQVPNGSPQTDTRNGAQLEEEPGKEEEPFEPQVLNGSPQTDTRNEAQLEEEPGEEEEEPFEPQVPNGSPQTDTRNGAQLEEEPGKEEEPFEPQVLNGSPQTDTRSEAQLEEEPGEEEEEPFEPQVLTGSLQIDTRNKAQLVRRKPIAEEGPLTCCVIKGKKTEQFWTPDEDKNLSDNIKKHGEEDWPTVAKNSGLSLGCKSIRLRWANHLRPDVKRGKITQAEEDLIIQLRHNGKRWSEIAKQIPGRTDNQIKNYWNTHLSEKLKSQGTDPTTHQPLNPPDSSAHHDHANLHNFI